ncbi:hypothetical protein SISSUDRAFT_1048619 [Sistotremastrum suecicum HHB10207 ss-3]|uniref:Uncharacterized protein n=1 Tax=Sistotremastrum suecicum HHB10207 ss-3 TaxID=1314776 RepID=A0A166CCJ2_9AGAM|nr:hypothetical protein SISSUDRAFT_1048619 [Sistotremastrum suecicum HHB10207 ss-3]
MPSLWSINGKLQGGRRLSVSSLTLFIVTQRNNPLNHTHHNKMPPVKELTIRIIPSDPSESDEVALLHDAINPNPPISPGLSSGASSPNLTNSSLPVTTGAPENFTAEESVVVSVDLWETEFLRSPAPCDQCPPGQGGPPGGGGGGGSKSNIVSDKTR